jgi:DNA-binding beta-propeller fold protein YncE
VVANRGSGSISVIHTSTNELLGTYALPAGAQTPEPMYVVYVPATHQVLVNDRANNRVLAFDADSFEVEAAAATGAGSWHMWADPKARQLWVNNELDKSATVLDPITLELLATVPMPADLVALGGKPHDVILDPKGKFAYVTLVGLGGPQDYVVQYSTESFRELGRAAVGKDPHVSLSRHDQLLYVPCQNSSVVVVLDRRSLELRASIEVPGAHGIGLARGGRLLYITNLPGGGSDGLFAIDTRSMSVLGSIDTITTVPHNLAIKPNGRKLYLTHSGTNNQVSIFTATRTQPVPLLSGQVTVGINPFGLAMVP